ncbi:MAG: DUF5658 family protein [Capsulimonadales bacterium]|nr:DUF5658 family protein [Capsulimonadales bacterium]
MPQTKRPSDDRAALPSANAPERRRKRGLIFHGPLRLRRTGEKEAFFMVLICTWDMYTTLWWVIRGEALEANPLLAWTFTYHPIWFVLVKSLLCLPAMYFLTKVGQRSPRLTVLALRTMIVVYISIYCLTVG